MDKESQRKWDLRFLELAVIISGWSKDPSTKCGCVITKGKRNLASGFNGYPSGIKDNPNDSRDTKLMKTIHAEVNAILYAGQDLRDCTLYVYPFQPCGDCASMIIQSGIKRVVVGMIDGLDFARWEHSFKEGEMMMREKGIEIVKYIIIPYSKPEQNQRQETKFTTHFDEKGKLVYDMIEIVPKLGLS